MKRQIKRLLKAAWRSTVPIRRPILAKVEQFLRRCLTGAGQGLPNETDVLMDHMVRELVRLQRQVEALELAVLDRLPARSDEIEEAFSRSR